MLQSPLVQPSNYSLRVRKERDFPALMATSEVSPHLRFGSISLRELIKKTLKQNEHYLNELIWREFFMQILYHYPKVVSESLWYAITQSKLQFNFLCRCFFNIIIKFNWVMFHKEKRNIYFN